MFKFIKQDAKEILAGVDSMDKKTVRLKFIISVIIGVIGGIAFTIFFLSQGGLTIAQLIMIISCWLVGDLLCIFAFLLDWRLMFRPFVAPFKANLKYIFLVIVLIPLALLIYSFVDIAVGFKGIIHMNSAR
ncbi:MAG: hypothetical protein IJ172_12045 [Ruminococcus sp.]|nr:hypothetical protein [Ruminococcus sp.]